MPEANQVVAGDMAEAKADEFAKLASLEAALGHTFARPELLINALTHRSQSFEAAMESTGVPDEHQRADNERLEFLGDAVLGLVVAESLYQSHPNWQEGELTRLRAQLVSRKHMADVALAIRLGDHLRLGKGEERSGGRKKLAILANAMEAVLAAMYLDALGSSAKAPANQRSLNHHDRLAPVRRFAEKHILGTAAVDLARELRSGASLGDHKSALQEHLQASHSGIPTYLVESESGPDHRKRFLVALRLKSASGQFGETVATGTGSTKKKAEQEAARRALQLLAGQNVLAMQNSDEIDIGDEIRAEEPAEV